MAQTFTVGRFFDIRVGIHVSWLAVYAFLTFSIASAFSDLGRTQAYTMGAICALAVFLSVTAHEFGHALVARRFGVRTQAITLFLFGGVATLEREPPTPRAEIAIALAGPAMSAVLGALGWGLFALVIALAHGKVWEDVAVVIGYVAIANGVLAVFNLLPSFPMDGGRVLRATLWRMWRSHARATAAATFIGIPLSVGLLGLGVFLVIREHRWQDGWYIVLGAFLTLQSVVAYRRAREAVAAEGSRPELHRGAAEPVIAVRSRWEPSTPTL
jgi:Zn-dependent protease